MPDTSIQEFRADEFESADVRTQSPHENSSLVDIDEAPTVALGASDRHKLTSFFSVGEILQQDHAAEHLPAALIELHRVASERTFDVGDYLIRQGEMSTSLIVIREGRVQITIDYGDASHRVIACSGPGEVLGEMALLTHEPRTASAVAIEPVKAAFLDAEDFQRLTCEHPFLNTLLTQLIAKRLGSKRYDALSGKQLDEYEIVRRLGRGGMSVVYEALDTRDGLRVALKMLSHRLACTSEARSRFQYEADVIERFDHPNIVKMLRRFAAFNTFFIVMEYCEGKTLAKVLKDSGAMQPTTFRRTLAQVAKALAYAHDEGICHRDVKPANIMCLLDGSIKLMDFGLAEPSCGNAADGIVIGTPRYMSPEQRAGRFVDKRTDSFSLGCVAYEMLTGKPLFSNNENRELGRNFTHWQAPDFAMLGDFDDITAKILQGLLAVEPQNRFSDLMSIANWDQA